MSASRITRKASCAVLALLALSTQPSCTAMQRQRSLEIALFPINVVPDIVANTALLLTWPLWEPKVFDSNIAPALWILTPLLGPRLGIDDAWGGYPFWNPAMLRKRSDNSSPATQPTSTPHR